MGTAVGEGVATDGGVGAGVACATASSAAAGGDANTSSTTSTATAAKAQPGIRMCMNRGILRQPRIMPASPLTRASENDETLATSIQINMVVHII